MKTIIAPTDFSEVSLNAVNYAADMAKALQADLILLHVSQLPMSFSEVPVPSDLTTEMIREAEKSIQQLKEDIVVRTAGQVNVETDIETGTVVTETEQVAGPVKPYAVVMGTHGSSGIERTLFGSNTIDAMNHLSWPLIAVPPDAKFTSIKRIGLACDLKKVTDTIPVNEITSLVKEFNAELHVLHVNKQSEKAYHAETISEAHSLQNLLQDFDPVYHFLNDTNIEEGLIHFAEKNKLDLLIVVPKKHNAFDKLFHKSRAKNLVLQTHVPVMSVHE